MARHGDITVVIPCFNHGRFLLESVDRALRQHGGPPKVIVVDDGSTDAETDRALDELPEGVELIRQRNAGVAAARNAGFENSDSELLLMVDADDRLTLDAIDTLRPPLEANADVGYCYGLMKLIGAWSGVLRFRTSTRTSSCTARSPAPSSAWSGGAAGRTPEGSIRPSTATRTGTSASVRSRRAGAGSRSRRSRTSTASTSARGTRRHRRRYRHVYRQLRAKHADLFARRKEFAAQTDLGPLHRLTYRTYWAWRPIPARVEKALYGKVLFRERSQQAS